jgi:tetratricopeptide (TPR) repeat protein
LPVKQDFARLLIGGTVEKEKFMQSNASSQTPESQTPESPTLEIVKARYKAGLAAFERGQYRQAVQELEKASALANRNSRLGGEVQLLLVTAYEAAGQRQEAIALCEQLKRHPHYEINKQGRRLLYILQAPQLQRPAEWMTQIPDLGAISDNESQIKLSVRSNNKKRSPQPEPTREIEDLSQMNTKDNRFILAALIAIGFILGALIWWGL